MVSKEWKDALRRYMDAVHQTLLDGRTERLAAYYGKEPTEAEPQKAWWETEREQWIRRGARPVAVRGKVTPLYLAQVGDRLEAVLSWQTEMTFQLQGAWERKQVQRLETVRLVRHGEDWAFLWPWGWYFDGHHFPQPPEENVERDPAEDRNGEGRPDPARQEQGGTYKREMAVAFAERYWNSTHPAYLRFNDDCTNFISQCVHAGGIPMVQSGRRDRGWWYRGGKKPVWSYSWTVANSFYQLLKSGKPPMRAVQVDSPEQLLPGDVICYDFDGDGRWQHNTIVVAKDEYGMPLVNAHTTDSRLRKWDYRDSTAYTPRIRYAFFHIRG